MKRQHQLVLIASTLAFSWLAMQAVHESGHVVGAFLSGGRVDRVVLHPATISQTRLSDNPHPLFVVWMGPIVGVAAPLVAMIAARVCKAPGWYLFQFFAGFCLVANGAYLGFGSLGEIGDAGDMLRYGMPIWLLWLFGLVTLPLGLLLWNHLGPHFGLGTRGGQVSAVAAYTMLGLTVATAALELVLSPVN
ncbi:MAG: M50 family metallopeptidase [Planctomycetes bacterium]|nr:M50 family metallopeptidase [Planctomycetota bacterium]